MALALGKTFMVNHGEFRKLVHADEEVFVIRAENIDV